jgi:Tfp pilus assembly protein PilZ
MSEGHFRRSARIAIDLRVSFRRDASGSALEKAGRIADLGMGGAFVESERPPPVGTEIVLTLQAPTAWDPLELPAEVRWIHDGQGESERDAGAEGGLGAGFGLSFRALSKTQAAALYELITSTGFSESAG